jgi:hypothetical protein
MAVSVLITNTTAAQLELFELYSHLGPAGSATESITIDRSVAQLDAMPALQGLLDAGDVTIAATQSASNVDLLSVPLEQHGLETGIDVNAIAVVTTGVVYPSPFPTGVVPVVTLTLDKTNGPAARGAAWVINVTNLGFDLVYDVTTADAGLTNDCNWVATY